MAQLNSLIVTGPSRFLNSPSIYGDLTINGNVAANSFSSTLGVPSYTLTKSSGTWTAGSVAARQFGNVVQVVVSVKGTGSAVNYGSAGFVGTINLYPVSLSMATSLTGLYSTSLLIATLNTSGTITIVPMGSNNSSTSVTIPNGTTVYVYGTFLVD